MPSEESYTWSWLDDDTKVSVTGRGATFALALAAAGYVNDLGRYVKAKTKPAKPEKPTAPPVDA